MWLPAAEALRRLNVKPQTLYANVSRGRIGAKPDPAEPRRSLYNSDDVDRLARRTVGRPRAEAVAVEAINWGEPVLRSALSTVSDGRLYYRGQDAVELAERASLEDIAELLWGGFLPLASSASAVGDTGVGTALVALAQGGTLPGWADLRGAPWWSYSGGLIVAFYVFTITLLAPRLGVGTAISLVVTGQILAALTIDHFGLLWSLTVPLSPARLGGATLMVIGVYLALRR